MFYLMIASHLKIRVCPGDAFTSAFLDRELVPGTEARDLFGVDELCEFWSGEKRDHEAEGRRAWGSYGQSVEQGNVEGAQSRVRCRCRSSAVDAGGRRPEQTVAKLVLKSAGRTPSVALSSMYH